MKTRAWLTASVKCVISVGLIYWFFPRQGLADYSQRLFLDAPLMLLLAVGAIIVSIVLASWRWLMILQTSRTTIHSSLAFRLVYIGVFFNQFFPSSVGGDVVRLWYLRKTGIPIGKALNGLLLDRVIATLSLSIMVIIALPLIFSLSSNPLITGVNIFAVSAVLLLSAALMVCDRLPGLKNKIETLRPLAKDSRRILLAPLLMLKLQIPSLLSQLLFALTVYFLARGMNINLSLLHSLLLVPPAILATIIPVSFAGWGVREGAMIVMLGLVDISQEQAFSLSVAFGIVVLIASLPGGLIWLVGAQAEPET